MSGRKKIRVGILLDSLDVPAWIHSVLKRITSSDFSEIVVLILNGNQKITRPDTLPSKHNRGRKPLFYRAYWRLEDMLFRAEPDAFEIVNLEAGFEKIPSICARPLTTGHEDHFSETDIDAIGWFKPDVLIRLGSGIPCGKVLDIPRYGVWSCHGAGDDLYRNGPTGFGEVIEKSRVTESSLCALRNKPDSETVLYRSYASTDPLSVKRNRNYLFWKNVSFFPRALEDLHVHGEAFWRRHATADGMTMPSRGDRSGRSPGNIRSLYCIMLLLCRYLRYRLSQRFLFDQWFLLFDIRNNLSTAAGTFKKMIPPRDRFWADPFVVSRNGAYHVFIEEYEIARRKGCLSVFTMDENGVRSEPRKILERPYHLSYPFVFPHRGEFFIIPESMANRTIELYRCVEFPGKWEFVRNLMEGVDAVDTTLFHDRKRWWMFTTLVENRGGPPWDELFLFYAEDLFTSRWKPHPGNPIVSDVRRARPAGRIFEHEGNLIRPAQDCSYRYGYAVVLNHILVLNENEYVEQEKETILPDRNRRILGVHTLNRDGCLTMMDGCNPRFKRH